MSEADNTLPQSPDADGDRFLISDLCHQLEGYLNADQIQEVYHAYLVGSEAHVGQVRQSGEPYIYHPIEVASILAEMQMDHQGIVAAILHDVIEDTEIAKDQIAAQFGGEVAELVDGVSKLTMITFETKAHAQAENFRKMMLAMARDIRVILIKLADRLHNMRTLGALRPEKRRRIARETLEIYVPIATRLGLNHARLELEDLGFEAYYPMRYRILSESVKKARGNRREILDKIETAIHGRLEQESFAFQLGSREKHVYSIYKKMIEKDLSFNEVMDLYAFRIIVDDVDTCYRALGVMHNLYKPVPGKFKDYIAIPKANGYQSLHTILFGPYGVPIEVQIRSTDMDRVAESGIAAHWQYKTGEKPTTNAQARAREWLQGLLEMQKSAGDSLEFLENVKIDLFPDEVYVFTPKGEIMEMPRGATAVDFAYAVHSDIGNSCVAARIDRRLVPLRTALLNGQTVEVITAPGAHPNPAWLNFVFTGKARANIRSYLKNLQLEEAVSLGRRLLGKALTEQSSSLEQLDSETLAEALREMGFEQLDKLLAEIGLGNRMAQLVARRLAPQDHDDEQAPLQEQNTHHRTLFIKGTEGMVVNFAKCCRPIPGDPIVGFVSTGRGFVIHVAGCKNVADYRDRPEMAIDVQWEQEVEGDFPVEMRVEVSNERGVLATVAAAISEMGSNIDNVAIEERDGLTSTITFLLAVHDRRHLARIMRRIRSIGSVLRIYRTR
ncbi:bifunctional GTP diphosphokinase/guanosine-3',5'-bis(diphosphate) 3'-diphosphatase [Solemya pervernicosa gill symbiont]|uniref:guanosine-3',5'-bis(diphosphate) 3'-diphosphatase n=2 Tax=Gammaproteobacteria incertae sedis TaxID=118884 RepID=A0A1T2LB62_9GAMM|nr:bifunctional GTP diphosphokinase/guanosine-3',5'-bis pyrophosphate 3'-pyrophosphohydrolase [Candidatus Reidiella endopervernicosa]OOZ42310.1 bifunctional GTP diphosphokinase/guanosine-3',5'-bis(diphosphate) 3'-diphosphatase [Solemya pervernicosa gill symbiont]QKQ25706.1 bifunctional GTP diphosphokinase/guanosine-3',5'-bis pyrophosphate 3'-pyrophosphohydrolase [Candidatus Reidiella endopervernicosa]